MTPADRSTKYSFLRLAALFRKLTGHPPPAPLETAAVKRDQTAARTGRLPYSVRSDEGTTHIRDEHRTLQRVRARTRQGTLEPRREINVLGYDPQQSVYEIDDATSFVDRA